MKLTNYMKDAIVNAVMLDVPHEYSHEQAHKDATAKAVALLPAEVQKLWHNNSTRHFVATRIYSRIQGYLPIVDKCASIEDIADRADMSWRKHRALRDHVHRVVYQFNTNTSMLELIPELEKYIPKQPPKTKQLPVCISVMEELKAAGFPKKA